MLERLQSVLSAGVLIFFHLSLSRAGKLPAWVWHGCPSSHPFTTVLACTGRRGLISVFSSILQSSESAPLLLILYMCTSVPFFLDEIRLLEKGDSPLSSALPEWPSHDLIWVARGPCLPPHLGLLGDPLVNRHLLAGVMCSVKGVFRVMSWQYTNQWKEGKRVGWLKEEEEGELSHR